MKVAKSGGLYKGVTSFLKRMDFYGYKVQLHYKNDPEFKSTLGGALTLVAFSGIFAYFAILLS